MSVLRVIYGRDFAYSPRGPRPSPFKLQKSAAICDQKCELRQKEGAQSVLFFCVTVITTETECIRGNNKVEFKHQDQPFALFKGSIHINPVWNTGDRLVIA